MIYNYLRRLLIKSSLLRIQLDPFDCPVISRYQHHTPPRTMEEDAVRTSEEGTGDTVKEPPAAEGTGKRKSEEADAPEKSSRGKRRRGGGGKKPRPGERFIPPPQKRNPGVSFSQEHFNETTHYFEGGLRKVHPYYYDFKTYCKGRWIGKSLLEVFKDEFRSESIEYYQKAAQEGRIRLNETIVEDLSIVLRNNDHMRNTVHRHEPPVVGRPLEVIADDGEVLVVDKPASIPVHPCGRFRHNTVIFILGKELNISGLHTVHRLDRLTSGVLMFARTLEVSQKLDQLVRDRQLEKEYVCRVDGEFPEEERICEEPILVVSFKVGLCRVHPKGKDCRTVFKRLSFNGSSSVVRCRPLTGRTHQIRVHLQYLGFPILNDPVYGASAWGPLRGKGGQVEKSDEDLLKDLMEEHRSKDSLHLLDIPEEEVKPAPGEGKAQVPVSPGQENKERLNTIEPDGSCPAESGSPAGVQRVGPARLSRPEGGEDVRIRTEDQPLENLSSDRDSVRNSQCHAAANEEPPEAVASLKPLPPGTTDRLCSECKIVRQDPTEKELVMFLHALRYKGPDFDYSTRLPEWAEEDWVEDP
ncbi:pseudouridylate synthase RPUSD2 [Gadus morhua]|uniref:RNA pseudouridine synthase domain containing 2 n=1 Tax=Gadus morhua TaxID=8049 RepID=A0A8C5BAJ1_GADMO|nr:RNA pseudouridylate synthase domain-containing protein 2 [Gadus morhua]